MSQPVNFKQRICLLRPQDAHAGQRLDDGSLSLAGLARELESDRGRIINSAAVRRLQQKTQVFPLERNAAVRSRLTHSLEVQQTGRFIVRTLFQQLGERAADYGLDGLERPIESLIEMACLMHDVGNPPFGHFGEFAIGEWFRNQLPELFVAALPAASGNDGLRDRMLADLACFEGNAQGIRLVVRLLRLNLTYLQTACILKYVRPAHAPAPEAGSPGAYLAKKPGFYLSEEPYIQALGATLGMTPGRRHPLVYIMEAADDIAYCLADIEDSVEKGILDMETLAQLLLSHFARRADPDQPIEEPGSSNAASFRERVADALQHAAREPINKVGEFFVRLRVNMIHALVQHAAAQFIDNIEAVYHGSLDRALLEDGSLASAVVATFKDVAKEKVFCYREVETLHLRGYRILQGLLDFYAPLLKVTPEQFQALAIGQGRGSPQLQMLARRLPAQLLGAYHEGVRETSGLPVGDARLWEYYQRCRMLQDFISGMTDHQAEDEYRILAAL
jgi:dGTPase